MMFKSVRHRENVINSIVWCVVGGFIGFLTGLIMKSEGTIALVENVAVGIFGAFIGGDFVVAMMNSGVVDDKHFSIRSLAFAVVGAIALVLILRLMRRSVGPLRSGKPKPRRNY
jgi:uncharacterized membrane protein YeaQ/YmgE (transglycosylase-associated protein family)